MKKNLILLALFIFLGRMSWAETSLRISPANSNDSGCDLSVANFDSIQEFQYFFEKLKKASTAHNKKLIADKILYPMNINFQNKRTIIKNKTDFLNHFSGVWTSNVSEALNKQEISKLFCNYQGVMIGDGQIWIKKINGKIGIGAINP